MTLSQDYIEEYYDAEENFFPQQTEPNELKYFTNPIFQEDDDQVDNFIEEEEEGDDAEFNDCESEANGASTRKSSEDSTFGSKSPSKGTTLKKKFSTMIEKIVVKKNVM